MSCGPSKKLKELAEKVQAAEDKFDSVINESPLGKLNEIKNDALEDVNNVMGKMESMVPSILNKTLDFVDKNLHEDVSDLLKLIMLGSIALPRIEYQLEVMKDKWSGVSLGDIKNFDDLRKMLETGALDVDSICKLIPNLEKDGVDVIVKATPTSFPDIDPAAILKGGPLPNYPTPQIKIDVVKRTKEQAQEFLNLELPDFDW